MRVRWPSIRVVAGITMAALCTACVEHGSIRSQPVSAVPPPTVSSSRVELIIRNAKQEVVSLRADLGAARISAAKKEVEVEELRRETAHLRQRVGELQQAHDQQAYIVAKQQMELSGANVDRDRLQSEKSAMQRELAELPSIRQALSASQMAEGQVRIQVKELEVAVAALKEELMPVKAAAMEREGRVSRHRSSRQSVAASKGSDSPAISAADEGGKRRSIASADKSAEADAVGYLAGAVAIDPRWTLVTVKPGETLSDLAREHGTTIDQIKGANGLVRDGIKSGQRLRVPSGPQQ